MDVVKRFDVWMVGLDPTVGSELNKTRPCVVVSPDELNRKLNAVMIAPLTSTAGEYSWRPRVRFEGREGQVVIDQMRSVDKQRLAGRLGRLSEQECRAIFDSISHYFSW